MNLQTVFPSSGQMGPCYDRWTWDAFLVAAEKCAKAGHPFGLAISNCSDAYNWIGGAALRRGFILIGRFAGFECLP
jgi:hypothetical protein